MLVVLIVVAYDVGTSGRIWKKYSKTVRIAQSLDDLVSPLKCDSRLKYLFEFDEGELRESLYFLNYAVERHDLSEQSFITVFRDAAKP